MFDTVPNTLLHTTTAYHFISHVIEPRDYYKKAVDSVIALLQLKYLNATATDLLSWYTWTLLWYKFFDKNLQQWSDI